jgi:CMP-N-acetylneuraminic acid synthetase
MMSQPSALIEQPRIVALIPLRAGSQRVKNKNIRKVADRYLFEYIIETAREARFIDHIVVNTDISLLHKFFAGESWLTLQKRAENLRGNCDMNLVIASAISDIQADVVVQLHATSPLLKASSLDQAIATFLGFGTKLDCLFSVTKQRKRYWNRHCNPINHKIGDVPTTQEVEPIYEENSAFYIFWRRAFERYSNRLGHTRSMYPIDFREAWDIDDENDLEVAHLLISEDKSKK